MKHMYFSHDGARHYGLHWVLLVILCCFAPYAVTAEQRPVIQVQGVSAAKEGNIRAYVSVENLHCALSERQLRHILNRSKEQTQNALRALGYYQPEIHAAITEQPQSPCWQLELDITPGEPVRIRRLKETVIITGEGSNDRAFKALLADLPMREGDILRHDQYESLKRSFKQIAEARGYFDAQFTQQSLRIDREALAADVLLHFVTGKRYQLGEIEVKQTILKDALMDKFISLKLGDFYESSELITIQQRLLDSGYFSQVRIDAQHDAADDHQLPLLLSLTPRPRWAYLAGVGASTDIGPRLRLGIENRYANRSGHRYESELELSPVRSSIGLAYEIPMDDPQRQRINLSTRFKTEDTDASKSDLWQFGAMHIQQHPSGWISTKGVSYEREDFTIGAINKRTDLLMPVFGLQRTRADHLVFPSRGWRLGGSIRGASEEFVSSVSFLQLQARAKVIEPLGTGRFIARVDTGTTWVDQFTDLPGSIRFFAGGDASVRGYAYQGLSPKDNTGVLKGGHHLLTGSLEYEYPLVNDFSVAAFIDAGNAFDRLDQFNPHYGVGMGVRWLSPIGPIRFDIAHPTDTQQSFRLHLTMGADL